MTVQKSRIPYRISLDTMRPQHIRVPGTYLAALGMSADDITDGLSIPWSIDGTRGTVWIAAHERKVAFDFVHYQIMQSLTELVVAAVRNQGPQQQLVGQAKANAHEETGHRLTLRANNWLHSAPEKTYLFRLNIPVPTVRVFVASTFEIHGDQLTLLGRSGELVALIVLDIIEGWCEVNRLFQWPDSSAEYAPDCC